MGLGVEPGYSDSQVRSSVPYPRRVWVASSDRGYMFGQALEVCRVGLMTPGDAGIREVKPPAADHTACVRGASSLMGWPSPSLGCAQSKGRATQTTGEGPRALRATLLTPVPGAGTGGPTINSPLSASPGGCLIIPACCSLESKQRRGKGTLLGGSEVLSEGPRSQRWEWLGVHCFTPLGSFPT